jgi:hypothetical protein
MKTKRIVDITFRSVEDFRDRIAMLWQDQKENEEYNFIFLCDQAEKEFNKLFLTFTI